VIRYYSFRPPFHILADGELEGQKFYLSALQNEYGMVATIRFASDLMAPIRVPLPSDIEQYELDAIVEVVAGSVLVAQEQAA
jgi:hypothetical protein